MNTDNTSRIIQLLATPKKAHELGLSLGISQVAIHKQLKNLLDRGKIKKIGSSPHTRYLQSPPLTPPTTTLPQVARQLIESNYLYITPSGQLLPGVTGFTYWATQVNHSKNITKLALDYTELHTELEKHRQTNELFNETPKLADTFPDLCLDVIYCSDFYSLPVFGKTKLGWKILYAKQTQNRQLTKEIITTIRPQIHQLIHTHKITAVGFIPPSIPRAFQFMDSLKYQLDLTPVLIPIKKIRSGDVIVPQKTLGSLSERILNAQSTIEPSPTPANARILLIDDALGSGATLQETARKLQVFKPATIIGYAIVGSYKGFEVIREA